MKKYLVKVLFEEEIIVNVRVENKSPQWETQLLSKERTSKLVNHVSNKGVDLSDCEFEVTPLTWDEELKGFVEYFTTDTFEANYNKSLNTFDILKTEGSLFVTIL